MSHNFQADGLFGETLDVLRLIYVNRDKLNVHEFLGCVTAPTQAFNATHTSKKPT